MQQICEKCGKVNLADAIQCTDCNSDLRTQDATVILSASSAAVAAVAGTAAMELSPSAGLASRFNTCPACSTVNVANASICRSCGHQLASALQTLAVTQTSLSPVSDLDDTRPPIPPQELGAEPAAVASNSKKTLWIALGAGGLLIAAALAWWFMSAASSSKNAPVKPNPFALPPEAMVSAPATPAVQTPVPVPTAGSTAPAQDAATSMPLVSQSLSPQETIVESSTPAANNARQATARDTASKQASPREGVASAPGKKDTKATDATRPSTQAARTTAPAPLKESTAARPNGAAAPNSTSAEAASATGQPAPPAQQANSPKEVCSTRFVLAQPFCMQEQCGLPRFTNHAQCVQMRTLQQETQQKMQDRN
jgi:ribosomal protein L40E